jgi:hypothetical protein
MGRGGAQGQNLPGGLNHGYQSFRNRPNILIFFTILPVAVSFAWLGVQDPSQWPAGVALYILGRKCCPLFPYHFTYLGPSDIISGQYRYHLLVDLSADSSIVFFYVLVCCVPRPCAQSPGSSSLCRTSEKGIKVVSAVLNILRPSSHPLVQLRCALEFRIFGTQPSL